MKIFRPTMAATIAVAMLMAGCKPQVAQSAQTSSRPSEISGATLVSGSAICPLEIINGNSIRQSRILQAGTRASFVGWGRVADEHVPVPPLVYVVFRSTVPDGSPDLFWPGVRVARPDHSEGNPLMANNGWSAAGDLPRNPGKYKVMVWVGDAGTQRECDTHEVLDLNAQPNSTLLLPSPVGHKRP